MLDNDGGEESMTVRGYKLTKRLGSGSCGVVWRALAPGGVSVAVKTVPRSVHGEVAQRELRALEAIKALRHAYLIQIHSCWVEKDFLYIAMELADCSLRDQDTACRAADRGGIPLPDLLRYNREIAEAVDFLNRRGVIHRDVKPDNGFLVGEHAKLGDCGMARLLRKGDLLSKYSFAGTIAYMAPETLSGQPNGRSDQYSLATMYAELRLGRLPYPCTDLEQWVKAHFHERPDLEPLGEKERQVILKALAKDPGQRYESCLEFARALEWAFPEEIKKPTTAGDAAPFASPTIKMAQSQHVCHQGQ